MGCCDDFDGCNANLTLPDLIFEGLSKHLLIATCMIRYLINIEYEYGMCLNYFCNNYRSEQRIAGQLRVDTRNHTSSPHHGIMYYSGILSVHTQKGDFHVQGPQVSFTRE